MDLLSDIKYEKAQELPRRSLCLQIEFGSCNFKLAWDRNGWEGCQVQAASAARGEGADIKCDLCEWGALGCAITHQHMPPFQKTHIKR